MADESYEDKVYRQQDAERLVVASDGSLDVESGGEIDIESGGALKLAGTAIAASAAELDQRALNLAITLGTAGTPFIVMPFSGVLTKAYTVIDEALTTADETLVLKDTGGTALAGGTLTITQSGSAAGDIDSVSPSSNNEFAAGEKLSVVIGGENGTGAGCVLTFLFTIT